MAFQTVLAESESPPFIFIIQQLLNENRCKIGEIFKPCTFHGELQLIPWYSFATHSRTLKPDWTQWSVRLAVAWKLAATHGLNTWTFTHGANYYTLLFCAKPSTARSCETGLCVWLHPVLPISVSSEFLPNHTLGNILHTCKTCHWLTILSLAAVSYYHSSVSPDCF